MEFIDTHAHNADPVYDGVRDQVFQRARLAGVSHIIQADTEESERVAMYALVEQYPGFLHPMLGLYPGHVTKDWQSQIDAMLPYLERGPVAIGEIGLDYHEDNPLKKEQMDAFAAQLEIASRAGLSVNIHLREATEDFFKVIESCARLGLRGNLHAFSGSAQSFKRLSKYGDWYVGIGGVLTFKNASLAREAAEIPLERMVLETDSPYLSPSPLRGTLNESANIPLVASFLAGIKKTSLRKVAELTTANAKKLFLPPYFLDK